MELSYCLLSSNNCGQTAAARMVRPAQYDALFTLHISPKDINENNFQKLVIPFIYMETDMFHSEQLHTLCHTCLTF